MIVTSKVPWNQLKMQLDYYKTFELKKDLELITTTKSKETGAQYPEMT